MVSSPDDTWRSFLDSHQVGQTVTGFVRRIKPYGVFVEFIPGQDGLVHRSQVLPGQTVEIDDLLWPGDQVRAVIRQIDQAEKRVHLSIADYLQRRQDPKTSPASAVPPPSILKASPAEYQAEIQQTYEALAVSPSRIRRILLVEDQGDLRLSLSTLLTEAGYEVSIAEDATVVTHMAVDQPYDLIFLDAHTPEANGTDVATQILDRHPGVHIVLMSGIPLNGKESERLTSLAGVSVLHKPFQISYLETLLDALEKGIVPPSQRAENAPRSDLGFDSPALSVRSRQDLQQTLREFLQELMDDTEATAAAIFGMNLVSREVEMLAAIGITDDAFERQRHELDISPVKDVIVDDEHILESDVMGQAAGKFNYMLPLLEFGSCIGLPLTTAGTHRYGLFLFHRFSGRFTVENQQRAHRTASAVNALIERHQIEHSLRAAQEFSLMGQISAGLAHEVNNRIAALEAQVRLLKLYSQSVERAYKAQHTPTADTMTKLQEQVEDATKTVDRLRRTAYLFQQLVSPQQGRVCPPTVPLQRAVEMVSTTADKNKVRIELDEPFPSLPLVRANDVALEQVFVNLLMNAVQQIGDQNREDGWVRIVAEYDVSKKLPVRIEVTDNGPGIHRRWWERVFDLGFSTRLNGSGLGLFMARSLVESFGGEIYVKESAMLAGTTFAVILPIAGAGGVN